VGDTARTVRNVVILLLIAAAVWRLPGGAAGERTVSNLVSIVFWGGLVFFAYRIYMERRTTLFGWDDRLRVRLYVSIALIMLLVVGTAQLFSVGGFGALLWFGLLGVAIWGIFTALRSARSY
jgi:polyferredoxin